MSKKFGFSWSWKRASGLTALKRKWSRFTGIPLSRSGRQRKVGKALGCCFVLLVLMVFSSVMLFVVSLALADRVILSNGSVLSGKVTDRTELIEVAGPSGGTVTLRKSSVRKILHDTPAPTLVSTPTPVATPKPTSRCTDIPTPTRTPAFSFDPTRVAQAYQRKYEATATAQAESLRNNPTQAPYQSNYSERSSADYNSGSVSRSASDNTDSDRDSNGEAKTVNVKGYTRKDGTHVRAHTRRAPSR